MKKSLSLFIIILFGSNIAFAQYTFTKGDDVMEISGILTPYFNYRFNQPGSTDHTKNSFTLDYAVFRLEGIHNRLLHYELQFNMARVAVVANSTTEDPGIVMDAYADYTGKYLNFKFGYSKVPFGRNSLIPTSESVFLQRAEVARGDVFSRRDIGITLNREFWDQKVNIIGGIYSGVGEAILNGGDNDPSGNFEYIGRVEVSYPVKFRYREVDEIHVPVPVFSAGGGMRYAEKATTTGQDYQIRTINGKKTSYSADFNIKYKGITLMGEVYRFHMVPNDSLRLLGYPTSYFDAGSIIGELNYYFKKYHSVLAVRYDDLNPTDLVVDDTQRTVSFGYNYLFNGMNSALKIHYFYRLERDDTKKKWADDQLRIAYQLQF